MRFFLVIAALVIDIRAGQTYPTRPVRPELPTIAEAGVRGYEATSWNGFAVRAGTPRAIIDRLQQDTRKVIFEPAVKEKLFELGIEPIGSTPQQFAAHVKAEREKWIPLFRKIGIQPQ